ncbi:MAG: hypothetical protein OWP43_11170 [Sphaerochaetaceae bacterium]|nr:hypothetical protein [Sphaerochaetaceae bacterium]
MKIQKRQEKLDGPCIKNIAEETYYPQPIMNTVILTILNFFFPYHIHQS